MAQKIDRIARVEILPDKAPANPRLLPGNLGTMACWHDHYVMGDVQPGQSMEDYIQALPVDTFTIPMRLHVLGSSYLWLSAMVDIERAKMLGVYHASHEDIEAQFGDGWASDKSRVIDKIRNELKDYSYYLNGKGFGYRLRDEAGNEIETRWGFLGTNAVTNGIARALPREAMGLLEDACYRAKLDFDPQEFEEFAVLWAKQDLERDTPELPAAGRGAPRI